MRDTTSFAVNIKPKFTLRVFGSEVDFSGGCVQTFGDDNEVMDEFLHLGQDSRFRGRHILPIGNVNGPGGQVLHYLTQDPNALSHFFDPDKIAIIAITGRTDDDIEVIFLVIQIRVFTTQIMFYPARAQVWT